MIVRTLILVALVALPATAIAAGAPKAPNVIVIVGDDMGYADVGVHGAKDIPTPHIDRLAKNGVRFSSGYVSGPQCSPTRAGLLTGRYQQRFGHEFNLSETHVGLPLREITMADRLKAAGYATGLVGKWHLGTLPHFHPTRRGFDDFYGFLGGVHSYFPERADPIFRGTKEVEQRDYLTDVFGREAVSFIDAHKAKPFFLCLAFNAVHGPRYADDARLERFSAIADERRRLYAAVMVAMDEAIGSVLTKLKNDGLLDNTLIVFLSDNGGLPMAGVTVDGPRNAPLRGSKRTTLEGGIRVPFFLHWPAKLPRGAVFDLPVIQLDVLPTTLAAIGVAPQAEWKLDGVNLLPHLIGDGKTLGPPHEALFWRFGEQMAVRKGDWKLVKYDRAADGGRGISAAKLYNVKGDIGETTDLAAQHPDRVQELRQAWNQWDASNIAPLWDAAQR